MQWRSPHLNGWGRVDGRPRERERGRRVVRRGGSEGDAGAELGRRRGCRRWCGAEESPPRLSTVDAERLVTGGRSADGAGDVDGVGRFVVEAS
jgi:hypothetical protein